MTNAVILFAALGIAAAVSAPHAQAASRAESCQTINGQTLCLRSSAGTSLSLSCQTTDGNTVCVGSGGLRCESVQRRRLSCHGGDGSTQVEIYGPGARDVPMPGANDDDDDDGR